MSCLKILYLEDDPQDAELVKAALLNYKLEIKLNVVSNKNSFTASLNEDKYDLLLLDYNVPSFSAVEALSFLKKSTIKTPAIVISGAIGDEQAAAAIRRGAVDYILKDNLSRLPHCIDRAMHEHKLKIKQKEQSTTNEQLIAATHAGIFKMDRSGNLSHANDQLSEMFDIEADELLGNRLFSFIHPEDYDSFMQKWNTAFSKNEPFHLECRAVLNNNGIKWLSISCMPELSNNQLAYYIGTVIDITQHKLTQEMLSLSAMQDALTQLPNRLSYQKEFDKHLQKLSREVISKFAIFYIDLDNFKHINDSFGHHVGDKLLQQCSKRFKDCLRVTDFVARIGGDEFVILTSDLDDVQQTIYLANRILAAFRKPFMLNDVECFVTVSIGIYTMDNQKKIISADEIVKKCDFALYHSKDTGKNNFSFYDEDIAEKAARITLIEKALRNAIHNNELTLCYQPQFNLQTSEIIGCEALLRWHHPELGDISPIDFIPIAEKANLIDKITNWVLQTAMCQLKAWSTQFKAATDRKNFLAINISPVVLSHHSIKTLAHYVNVNLDKFDIEPEKLIFELTETAVMDNIEHIKPFIQSLNRLGICVAIDDFGTGYSSLSHLKELPLTMLKIDESFIRDLDENEDSQAITKSIIMLGKAMNIDVIAEGVETERQLQWLKQYHCQYAQGYYFAKPMTAQDMTELLSSYPSP